MCRRDPSKDTAWLGKDECRLAVLTLSQQAGQSNIRAVLHGPFPSYKRELVCQPPEPRPPSFRTLRGGEQELFMAPAAMPSKLPKSLPAHLQDHRVCPQSCKFHRCHCYATINSEHCTIRGIHLPTPSTNFGAAPSASGYLYQCRLALALCLKYVNVDTGAEVGIERLNDVSFETAGTALELLQATISVGSPLSRTRVSISGRHSASGAKPPRKIPLFPRAPGWPW